MLTKFKQNFRFVHNSKIRKLRYEIGQQIFAKFGEDVCEDGDEVLSNIERLLTRARDLSPDARRTVIKIF